MTDETNTVPLLSDQLLEDYADGRLDPQTERRVEGLIANDRTLRDKVLEMIAVREAVRADVTERAGTPSNIETYRLVNQIERRRAPARTPRLGRLAGAAAASIVVLGVSGAVWTQYSATPDAIQQAGLRFFLDQTTEQTAQAPDNATRQAASANQNGGEVTPATVETVPNTEKHDTAMPEFVPDFSESGYKLVETRVISDSEKSQAVHLLYEGDDGRRVSLYYSATGRSGKQQVSVRQEGPLAVMFWYADKRSFSMIGEVERAELLKLARTVTAGLSLDDQAAKTPSENQAPEGGGSDQTNDGDAQQSKEKPNEEAPSGNEDGQSEESPADDEKEESDAV